MKVAANQSNYLPWKGYFDIINSVDLFIFYDDVQYTHGDWRNRNLLKTKDGIKWITVPVGNKVNRLICDVNIDNNSWQEAHYQKIYNAYHKAKYFADYRPLLEDIYLDHQWANLSVMNQYLIRRIAVEYLGIKTQFSDSRGYDLSGKRETRIVDLLWKTGASEYLVGPAARSYLREELLASNGIRLRWMDYSGYPEYPQFHPPFEHKVTILDLLFHTGPKASSYIWGCRTK